MILEPASSNIFGKNESRNSSISTFINSDGLSLTKSPKIKSRDTTLFKIPPGVNIDNSLFQQNGIYQKIQDTIAYNDLVENISSQNTNNNFSPLFNRTPKLNNYSSFADKSIKKVVIKKVMPIDTQTDKVYIQYPDKIKKRRIIDTYKNNIEANRNKIQDEYLNSNPFIVSNSESNVNTIFTTPFTPPSKSGDSTVKQKNKAKLL